MVNLRITDFNSLTEPLSLNNNIDFFSILNQIINTASDLNCCSYSFRQFRVTNNISHLSSLIIKLFVLQCNYYSCAIQE